MAGRRKQDRRSIGNFDSDLERRTGPDRRESIRVMVDLEVDYKCDDTYLFAYITDMSAMGIFIRTNNPEPIGTALNLRFRLPGDDALLVVEGKVTWVNTFRPGDLNNIHPGMGVKFLSVDRATKKRLLELVRTMALLEDIPERAVVRVSDN